MKRSHFGRKERRDVLRTVHHLQCWASLRVRHNAATG